MSKKQLENKTLEPSSNDGGPNNGTRPMPAAAKRALAEADARRAAANKAQAKASQKKEIGGRKGPDPVRFGDWENGGIVSDF